MPYTTLAYIARHPTDRRTMKHKQTPKHVPPSRRWAGPEETNDDPLENLRVDVHDPYILVALLGTCFRANIGDKTLHGWQLSEHSPGQPQMRRLVNLGGSEVLTNCTRLLPLERLACAPMHVQPMHSYMTPKFHMTPKFKWPASGRAPASTAASARNAELSPIYTGHLLCVTSRGSWTAKVLRG